MHRSLIITVRPSPSPPRPPTTEPLFGTAAERKREERFETKNSCDKPWLRHADAFPHYLFDGATRSVTPPKRGK